MKKLMDGYVGVKFHADCRSLEVPAAARALFPRFARACRLLRENNMTPANGGNLSVRLTAPAFAITASGCNLGEMEEDELILVEVCDPARNTVTYRGPAPPSSESFLHHLIYAARPEVGAIVHAHDEPATRPDLLVGDVEETAREEPYGTLALARLALETIRGDRRIIVLKNHGYVAVGRDLEEATGVVLAMHARLLEKLTGPRKT